MNKDTIKSEMIVNDRINVLRINNKDYISLTDLARLQIAKSLDFPLEIG